MDALTIYQFLKPSLEPLSEKEKQVLKDLIDGEPTKKAKVKSVVPTSGYYQKLLLKTVFKSKNQ